MDSSTMVTNFSVALISTVVSFVFTLVIAIIYWCRKYIHQYYLNKKCFKIYKQYAIEFLENCIASYDKKKFTFYGREYALSQLEIEIMHPFYNNKIESLHDDNIKYIPTLSLGFLSVKHLLDGKDLWLLRYILDHMCQEYKWFYKSSYYPMERRHNARISINFSEFNIQDKEDNILSVLGRNCFIELTKNTDKNKLETILTKLKHNEFDDRIKKAIKQWKTINTNTNH